MGRQRAPTARTTGARTGLSASSASGVPSQPGWHERDLEFSTLRASGPGATRQQDGVGGCVLHRPSGLSVVAREERSQAQNKRLALARLAALFAEQGNQQAAKPSASAGISTTRCRAATPSAPSPAPTSASDASRAAARTDVGLARQDRALSPHRSGQRRRKGRSGNWEAALALRGASDPDPCLLGHSEVVQNCGASRFVVGNCALRPVVWHRPAAYRSVVISPCIVQLSDAADC